MKISFLEIAPAFSNQVKLPYSPGVIWSYCKQNPKITEKYSLDVNDWIYIHDDVDKIFEEIKDCGIVGVSNFIWNQNINNEVCKKLKQYNENILIIYGGLGTPNDADKFLQDNEFIDVIVNGEGEYAFEELLLNYPNVKNVYKSERVSDIDSMPSPYLNGLFDTLIENKTHDYNFEALIEPTRGCPYTCTFCEIGDKYFTQIKKQSEPKVFKELEWISNHNIEYMHIIDNNFGMLPIHNHIADYIIKLKDKNNFPNALNLTWAKNKKQVVFDIAKKLQVAGLQKGVTIALQSMNNKTLQAIERSNLDSLNLKELFQKFRSENVPTYIELIMGLPLETIDSFKDNVYYIIDDLNYKNYIGMYHLSALPNTKFNDPEYVEKYKIKTIDTCPAFYHHSNPKDVLEKESEKIVVETSTMSYNDCIDLFIWKWFIMTFHFLGWLRVYAFARKMQKDTLKSLYQQLYDFMINSNGFVNNEYNITKKLIKNVLEKREPWGRKIKDVSNIYWEYEEATSIEIAKNKRTFYLEMEECFGPDIMLRVNAKRMRDPYLFKEYAGNLEQWAIECLWWGKRNERFLST